MKFPLDNKRTLVLLCLREAARRALGLRPSGCPSHAEKKGLPKGGPFFCAFCSRSEPRFSRVSRGPLRRWPLSDPAAFAAGSLSENCQLASETPILEIWNTPKRRRGLNLCAFRCRRAAKPPGQAPPNISAQRNKTSVILLRSEGSNKWFRSVHPLNQSLPRRPRTAAHRPPRSLPSQQNNGFVRRSAAASS